MWFSSQDIPWEFTEKKCRVVATSRLRSSMVELEHDTQEFDVQSDESMSNVVDAVVDKYGRSIY